MSISKVIPLCFTVFKNRNSFLQVLFKGGNCFYFSYKREW